MSRRSVFLSAALAAAALAVYWPVGSFDFVGFDDFAYVKDNAVIAQGLDASGIAWAFRTRAYGTYQPATWISYMIDAEIFGVSASAFHLVNLAIHAANVILLFSLLRGLTGAEFRSALVAALFAVHPQHVESVAWISERKDVLSMFFCLVAAQAYRHYVARPSLARYLAVALPFALGLLAKPMLISLPLLLLLLDYWPLSRWSAPGLPRFRPIVEKLPLLMLAGISSVMTYVAQREGGATTPLEGLSAAMRVENATVALARYLEKTVVPQRLGVIYPFEKQISLSLVVASALLVVALSAIAVRRRHRAPYFLAGWLWFLVALGPMIGLVQIGVHSMADRFMYLPHVGLFVGAVWWGGDLARQKGSRAAMWAWPLAGLVALLGTAAHAQVRVWRDSETLFRHTLAVTSGNWKVHYLLGRDLVQRGRVTEAVGHFRRAVAIEPLDFTSHMSLGNALYELGLNAEALDAYGEAARLKPQTAGPLYNMGLAWTRLGDSSKATESFRMALWLDPGHKAARSALLGLEAGGGNRQSIEHTGGK